MEVLKQMISAISSNLTTAGQKYVLFSAVSTGLGYTFFRLFLKKRKTNPTNISKNKNELPNTNTNLNTSFTKNQLSFIKKQMRLKGVNYSRMLTTVDPRKRKMLEVNNAVKKISQRSSLTKNDQVFYNIMQKFSTFVVKNKFAFA
jgi:hypothetical protein